MKKRRRATKSGVAGGQTPASAAAPAAMTQQDNPATAFPSSPAAPGQAQSRLSYEHFQELLRESRQPDELLAAMRAEAAAARENWGPVCTWWQDYLRLRGEGWDWRKATYIAWASSPVDRRWPPTQYELASKVLGLTSDRVIRIWREKDVRIDEQVALLQAEPLFRHRRDVVDALIASATAPDFRSSADRKLFFQLTGDLVEKREIMGKDGKALLPLDDLVAALHEAERGSEEDDEG